MLLKKNPRFSILALINPCNPTGEYLNVQQLKDYIKEQTAVLHTNTKIENFGFLKICSCTKS